ncbi:hypothetical protein [Homoserinibacter sp. YIM 151385]|uniref:hypothetical protein n=1 Tax=Homoserinibacter sp. YIM 151385 TaxID=2985506 RepID=UPI0022F11521|nr:hypothetical protein [Homoserinibacter sp. YIM 151385]WBU37662.1 hypothetical protein OF852_12180 [Homoserinibacter sp. YIM 151385]
MFRTLLASTVALATAIALTAGAAPPPAAAPSAIPISAASGPHAAVLPAKKVGPLRCDRHFCTVMTTKTYTKYIVELGPGAASVACSAIVLSVPRGSRPYAAVACGALGFIIYAQAIVARSRGECLGVRFTTRFELAHTVIGRCA